MVFEEVVSRMGLHFNPCQEVYGIDPPPPSPESNVVSWWGDLDPTAELHQSLQHCFWGEGGSGTVFNPVNFLSISGRG
jgi:hypothetical protein